MGLCVGFYWGGVRASSSVHATLPSKNIDEARGAAHKAAANQDTKIKKDAQNAASEATLESLSEDLATRVRRFTANMSLAEIEKAVQALAASPNAESNIGLRAELMRAWARQNIGSAWQYVTTLRTQYDRQNLVSAVVGELAKTNPQEALKRTSELTAPQVKASVTRKLFEDWSKVDPRAAVAYWNAHPDLPADSTGMALTFSTLARSNPSLAAELALQYRSPSLMPIELSGALKTWAEKDAGAARKWVESLPDAASREKAFGALAQALMEIDPKQGLEIAARMPAGAAGGDLTRRLLTTWMGQDPGSTIDYLARLPQAEAKAAAGSLTYVMGQLPVAEQQRLLEKMPEGEAKMNMITSLVANNNRSGRFNEAVGLLNELPDGRVRDQSLHRLATDWAVKDPGAALNWIQQQPDSSDRDLMVAAYAAQLAKTNPQAALKSVQNIPDVNVQIGALRNLYYNWSQVDANAANEWLNNAKLLSEGQRSTMRNLAAGPQMTILPVPSVRKYR